jgi:hypothetical protein
MSGRELNEPAIGWAWKQAVERSSHKHLLVTLAMLADDTGRCTATIAELKRQTGWSERTVQRSLGALKALELIQVTERQSHGSEYRLLLGAEVAP